MTTIAINFDSVAADGLGTAGYERLTYDCVKISAAPPYIFCFSGPSGMRNHSIEWFMQGAIPANELKVDEDWTLIVIDMHSVRWYVKGNPFPTDVHRVPGMVLAFGAGHEVATGALLAGVSPRRAVELVASRYGHTGGVITEINIDEALFAHGALKDAAD